MSGNHHEKSMLGEEVTEALRLVLDEMHQPPHGLHVEIEDVDLEKEIWKINVSKFKTAITGEEIRQKQKGGTDFETLLRNIIFEKLQWCTCEV
ncbi:MAG: hypothetical protein ACOYI2_06705 [Bacillota bacterium]|jgi:hypothetical protein